MAARRYALCVIDSVGQENAAAHRLVGKVFADLAAALEPSTTQIGPPPRPNAANLNGGAIPSAMLRCSAVGRNAECQQHAVLGGASLWQTRLDAMRRRR